MECEYEARLANRTALLQPEVSLPFQRRPQSPADHARALHGISTINAMRDTCLAAKGFRVD